MAVFIALLRAINVTGTGMVPMKDLKAACEAAGLKQVSTYIASGNIVFSSGKSAAAVKSVITGILRDRFGLTKNHTMIRTSEDLAKVIARNPFTGVPGEGAAGRLDRPQLEHDSQATGHGPRNRVVALVRFMVSLSNHEGRRTMAVRQPSWFDKLTMKAYESEFASP